MLDIDSNRMCLLVSEEIGTNPQFFVSDNIKFKNYLKTSLQG